MICRLAKEEDLEVIAEMRWQHRGYFKDRKGR